MINSKKLELLYNNFLDKKECTTKELLECGLTKYDLTKLVSEGELVRVKTGIYECKNFENLYCYGEELLSNGFEDKAEKCFLKCLDICPTHNDANFKLFYISIKRKDYNNAFKYLEKLRVPNSSYSQYYNLFLYMLGLITDIPGDLKANFDDLDYSKCQLLSQRFNEIIQPIFLGKLFKAKNLSESLNLSDGNNAFKILVSYALERQKENFNIVSKKIKNKEYEEALEFLNNINNHKMKIFRGDYILLLLNQIINIKKNGIAINRQSKYQDNVLGCLQSGYYELALEKQLYYNAKVGIDSESDILIVLIKDLIELSRQYNKNSNSILKVSDDNDPFDNIFASLLNNKFEEAFDLIRLYLKKINKAEYESYIINLIRQSVVDEDFTYTRPMYYLSLIKNNKIDLPIENINKLSNDIQEDVMLESLKNFLTDLEKKIEYLRSNGGVIILDSLPSNILNIALNFISSYSDIKFFLINVDNNQRLVLRYKTNTYLNISVSDYIDKSKAAYLAQNYKKAIEYCLKLLQVGTPHAILYYKLGICYLKLGDFNEASKYLTIAQSLDNTHDHSKIIKSIERYQKNSNIKGYQYIFRLNVKNKED